MGKGTAYGKTILIGDQFVLKEVAAIVCALPYETECIVERVDGSGWLLEDNRDEVPGYKEKKRSQQAESIDRILDVMGIDTERNPIKITYGGSLLAGSGVGASAASCVSLARALNEEFSLGYDIEQINRTGWEGEFAYHGIPSGVDNTASTYGGVLLFRIANGKPFFERILVDRPFEVVLADSGLTSDTSTLDAHVEAENSRDPALFLQRLDIISRQGREMKRAIEESDLDRVGSIMTENHSLLRLMGLSHERLDHLCAKALALGSLGAKVTGGGRGGYMVALTPGKELQARVASEFAAEGCKVMTPVLGGGCN
jgi:mevalonate kinase